MPNWCANNVTIAHDDAAKLDELADAYKRGELMEHYLPTPRDPDDPTKLLGEGKPILSFGGMLSKQGGSDWYSWRVNNWGTKWDVGGEDAFLDRPDSNTVVLSFDSAWSPPIEFYSFMKDECGFDIRASYFEPGMGFCGDWIDGMDNYYEVSDWREFPDHLIQEYNMDEFYEDEEEVA
jgi:hypothetical protein